MTGFTKNNGSNSFISPKILIGVALAVLFGVGYFSYWSYRNVYTKRPLIQSFEECVKAGYPVGESYPRQCFTPGINGKSFTEKIAPQPEQVDTSSWKTYCSDLYRFAFRYPSDWRIKTSYPENLETLYFVPEHDNKNNDEFPKLTIEIDNTTLRSDINRFSRDSHYRPIMLDGRTAYQEIEGEFGTRSVSVQLDIETVLHFNPNDEYLNRIFDQILSTFKFISSTSSRQAVIDTSDWHVYCSEEYGFEVRYPSTWGLKTNIPTAGRYTDFILFFPGNLQPTGGGYVEIHVSNFTEEEYISSLAKDNVLPAVITRSRIDVDGIDAIFVHRKTESNKVESDFVLISNNGYLYIISGNSFTPLDQSNPFSDYNIYKGKEAFEGMISTFKFIK